MSGGLKENSLTLQMNFQFIIFDDDAMCPGTMSASHAVISRIQLLIDL
jgi:hypothetical protein